MDNIREVLTLLVNQGDKNYENNEKFYILSIIMDKILKD